MANNLTASVVARNGMLAGATALLNSGAAELYDGTQPTTPDTAISTQVRLGVLPFSATAFGTPSGGSTAANAIGGGTGLANSTATWFRFRAPAATPGVPGTVTVASNAVTAIATGTGGSGYTTPPAVVISGGGGTGATATATVSAGAITGYTVTSGGSGYSGTPTVAVFGGGAAHIDGTVGVSGCDLNINSAAISVGEAISVTSYTLSHP